MSDKLVPLDTRRAAKRAFIRTAAQALASAIPTTPITIAFTDEWWIAAIIIVMSVALTSVLAGTWAYLDVLSKGIPAEYETTGEPMNDVV